MNVKDPSPSVGGVFISVKMDKTKKLFHTKQGRCESILTHQGAVSLLLQDLTADSKTINIQMHNEQFTSEYSQHTSHLSLYHRTSTLHWSIETHLSQCDAIIEKELFRTEGKLKNSIYLLIIEKPVRDPPSHLSLLVRELFLPHSWISLQLNSSIF